MYLQRKFSDLLNYCHRYILLSPPYYCHRYIVSMSVLFRFITVIFALRWSFLTANYTLFSQGENK